MISTARTFDFARAADLDLVGNIPRLVALIDLRFLTALTFDANLIRE